MSKILVLGGGRQGRVIAQDLSADSQVAIADLRRVDVPGIHWIEADLEDPNLLCRLMAQNDLSVGALPARLGFQAAHAAIEARRPYVDIAFYAEDAAALDNEARRAGIFILPDCGLAPGLSNLIVGHTLSQAIPEEVDIMVGGIAADPNRPFGYVVTWSIEDLVDEYTRPARILRQGKQVTVPALSGRKRIRIDGLGEFEVFFTDGLRTLLATGIPNMSERTIRWPGHVDQVRPLLESKTMIREFQGKCQKGEDLVVFLLTVRWKEGRHVTYLMIERPKGDLTAMSRTTALTCAAFTRWALSGGGGNLGVIPPEIVGRDERAYRFILDSLQRHGIRLESF